MLLFLTLKFVLFLDYLLDFSEYWKISVQIVLVLLLALVEKQLLISAEFVLVLLLVLVFFYQLFVFQYHLVLM